MNLLKALPRLFSRAASTPAPLTLATRLSRGLSTEQATWPMLRYFAQQLPDPDTILQKAGLSRADLRRLESDDEVIQCRDKRLDSLLSTPWRIEPNTTRAARFITEQLTPHMESLVVGAMNAVFYGYSVNELIYSERSDGRTGLHSISEKPFEWFVPRGQGDLRYHPADGSGGYEGLSTDPLKYLLTTHKASYRNPYGEAIYSRLWWPVFFRTQGWKSWALFLERFGTPMLLGKTLADPNKLASALAAAVQDAILVTGSEDEVSAVESGKDGQQFKLFEDAIVARIQKSILGQTLTSQVGSSGSFAAAKVHQDIQTEKRNADLRLVARTAQRLVDNLCALNEFPALTIVFADDTGLEGGRAQRDALLVEKGVLKLTEAYLLDRYDYKEGDFTIPDTIPAAAPPGEPGPTAPGSPNALAAAHRFNAPPAAVANPLLAETTQLARHAQPHTDALIAAVSQMVEHAPDLPALQNTLLNAYGGIDTERLTQLMTAALALAELKGLASVRK